MSIAALFAIQLLFPSIALLVIGICQAEADLVQERVKADELMRG